MLCFVPCLEEMNGRRAVTAPVLASHLGLLDAFKTVITQRKAKDVRVFQENEAEAVKSQVLVLQKALA